MPTTTVQYPTVGATTGSGVDWVNFGNAADAPDTVYATCALVPFVTPDSDNLDLTAVPDCDVPSGTVTGLTVTVTAKGSITTIVVATAQLLESGVAVGSAVSFANWSITATPATYANTASLFGLSTSALKTLVNSGNLGVRIIVSAGDDACTVSVDSAGVTVNYNDPVTATGMSSASRILLLD